MAQCSIFVAKFILGFHCESRHFLKMYDTTVALTKTYFNQNVESCEMIRGFSSSSLGFSELFETILWFSARRCPRSGERFLRGLSLVELGFGYTFLGAPKAPCGTRKPQESLCNLEYHLHIMQK